MRTLLIINTLVAFAMMAWVMCFAQMNGDALGQQTFNCIHHGMGATYWRGWNHNIIGVFCTR